MTNMDETVTESLWDDVEIWFDGIEAMLSHRCYQPHSMTGVRAIQHDVRKHLIWIDEMLLEIESLAAKAAKAKLKQVLRRVEEGMTTAADAEFLREILGIKAEKVVPNPVKGTFEQKSAR